MNDKNYIMFARLLQQLHSDVLRIRKLIDGHHDAGYAGLTGLSDISKHSDESKTGNLYSNAQQIKADILKIEEYIISQEQIPTKTVYTITNELALAKSEKYWDKHKLNELMTTSISFTQQCLLSVLACENETEFLRLSEELGLLKKN